MRARTFLFASLLSAAAFAVSAGESASIAPRAEELLRRTSETLATAKTLSFRADVTVDEVAGTGQKLQRGGIVEIRVRRPDRVYADHDGDRFHRKFVYDGKSLTILDVGQSLYAGFEAPPTIDGMLAFARQKFGVVLPLGQIVVAKPIEEMLPTIESGLYLGLHRVDGVPCHHLAFTQASVDWQLWVQDGATPLIRKLVVTYKSLPQSPQFTALLSDWSLGTPIPDSTFNLEIPKDASKIEFMTEAAPAEVKP